MSHNLVFESTAPDYVKERNNRLKSAYYSIINTIERIQGFLDDEYLRGRIESEMTQNPEMKSTLLQCTSPFCIVSLGCDQMGRYNIVFSIDYRVKEMIGDDMASGLLRRIFEFTPGEMEVFVRFGSLYQDCIVIFDQLLDDMQTEPFHEMKIKEKNT